MTFINTKTLSNEEILSYLHNAALQYKKLEGKNYLFVNRSAKSGEYHWYEICFKAKNFMHLTGFKSTEKTATEFYHACLLDPPALDYKTDFVPAYKHSRRDVCEKIKVLGSLLDLSKAKFFSVGDKNLITQNADFKFAYGKSAIIGFGTYKSADSTSNPPITCIPDKIEKFCSSPYKVTFIMEKLLTDHRYTKIHSEIKQNLAMELISGGDLPDELKRIVEL